MAAVHVNVCVCMFVSGTVPDRFWHSSTLVDNVGSQLCISCSMSCGLFFSDPISRVMSHPDTGSIDDWVVVTLLQGVCFKGLQRYEEAERSFKNVLDK